MRTCGPVNGGVISQCIRWNQRVKLAAAAAHRWMGKSIPAPATASWHLNIVGPAAG